MERLRLHAAIASVLATALAVAGCSSGETKPRDLPDLRVHLLDKACERFEHAFRITERRSSDPFNQAREHLMYTMVELGRLEEAQKIGQEYIKQNIAYVASARTKLAGIEIDWKKALAADPKIEGTKKEKPFTEAIAEWRGRIRTAERQASTISILTCEILLKLKRESEAIAILKDVLAIDPMHNGALRRLAQAYASIGEYSLAASRLEAAYMGLEERIDEYKTQLADALEKSEKQDETIPARINAGESAAVEFAAAAALKHILSGDRARVDEWFARSFALDPTSRFVELKLGVALLLEGREQKARENLARFIGSLRGGARLFFQALLDALSPSK